MFFKSDVIYCQMIKKREILFNFWQAKKKKKIQKHLKLIFLSRERKKEKKAKFREIACQNNDEHEIGSRKGQPDASWLSYGKNQTLRNGKFWFNFGLSNLMTHESCYEKGPTPTERRTERNLMRGEGSKTPL